MTVPEIQTYMPAPNGGRRRSFMIDGCTVIVEPHEDDARARHVAMYLAEATDTIGALRRENRALRDAAPPPQKARLLGPGCVRMRDRRLWLLNKVEDGWASFGLCIETWDDLFRRFDVIVTERGEDDYGDYWRVENTRSPNAREAKETK